MARWGSGKLRIEIKSQLKIDSISPRRNQFAQFITLREKWFHDNGKTLNWCWMKFGEIKSGWSDKSQGIKILNIFIIWTVRIIFVIFHFIKMKGIFKYLTEYKICKKCTVRIVIIIGSRMITNNLVKPQETRCTLNLKKSVGNSSQPQECPKYCFESVRNISSTMPTMR